MKLRLACSRWLRQCPKTRCVPGTEFGLSFMSHAGSGVIATRRAAAFDPSGGGGGSPGGGVRADRRPETMHT